MGNVVNRVFDSSGPDGKVRGTPQQIIDKYNQLARDAQLANDRVATENFQQHAEHYLRLLSEAQREQDNRREQQERENRERQAQRDRERAERQDGDGSGPQKSDQKSDGKPDGGDQSQPQAGGQEHGQSSGGNGGGGGGSRRKHSGSETDVVDFSEGDDNSSGLVDTPESGGDAPKQKPRRRSKPKKAQGSEDDGGSGSEKGSDKGSDADGETSEARAAE